MALSPAEALLAVNGYRRRRVTFLQGCVYSSVTLDPVNNLTPVLMPTTSVKSSGLSKKKKKEK